MRLLLPAVELTAIHRWRKNRGGLSERTIRRGFSRLLSTKMSKSERTSDCASNDAANYIPMSTKLSRGSKWIVGTADGHTTGCRWSLNDLVWWDESHAEARGRGGKTRRHKGHEGGGKVGFRPTALCSSRLGGYFPGVTRISTTASPVRCQLRLSWLVVLD